MQHTATHCNTLQPILPHIPPPWNTKHCDTLTVVNTGNGKWHCRARSIQGNQRGLQIARFHTNLPLVRTYVCVHVHHSARKCAMAWQQLLEALQFLGLSSKRECVLQWVLEYVCRACVLLQHSLQHTRSMFVGRVCYCNTHCNTHAACLLCVCVTATLTATHTQHVCRACVLLQHSLQHTRSMFVGRVCYCNTHCNTHAVCL